MKLYGPALLGMLLLAGCGSGDGNDPSGQAAAVPVETAATAPPDIPVMGAEVRVLALGDSLFTGYGLGSGESYPAKLEAALRARGINARIANAGVSGDTTAGGLQRLKFTLDSQPSPPALAVISLGGNDMLRGVSPDQTRTNLDAILTELGRRKIPAVLMGMLAAPNLGPEYRAQFDPIYPALAKEHGAGLVPFFLQPVIGRPELIQQDRIHPTAQGIEEMVAATVDTVAKALPVSPATPPPPR